MRVKIPGGKYVLAVSGGVDSMALLHLLAKKPGVELIVAHFNHGIRANSSDDEMFVRQAAASYGLPFEAGQGNLGPNASEASARDARYDFLECLKIKHAAAANITAHHQDDLIETAFINLIRGTGSRGLSSISNNARVLRPLLIIPKREILVYAQEKGLAWREDPTNGETDYLRNYLRLNILSKLTDTDREILISYLDKVAEMNELIDIEYATMSQSIDNADINREVFSMLPAKIGNELIARQLRRLRIEDIDSKTITRLSMAIKTSKPNSTQPVKQNSSLLIGAESARFLTP